jgi:hypothetical protein
MAMNVLHTFFTVSEEKRNESSLLLSGSNLFYISIVLDLELSKQATATPFHRTDLDCDEFHILAHTKPLFRNLPNPGNLTVRAMSLAELKSSSKCYTKILTYIFNHQILESTTLPRPAHMQPKKIDDITSETNDLTFNIRSLADPEDIY